MEGGYKRLVDVDTGEFIDVPVLDGEHSKSFKNNGTEEAWALVKAPSGHTVKARKNGRNPREFKDIDNFVKVFQDNMQQMILNGELTDLECAVLFRLQFFLSGYDGSIKIEGEPLNVKRLNQLLGWSKYGKLSNVLKSLENKDILTRYKVKGMGNVAFIQLNPVFFCKGNASRRKEQLETYTHRKDTK